MKNYCENLYTSFPRENDTFLIQVEHRGLAVSPTEVWEKVKDQPDRSCFCRVIVPYPLENSPIENGQILSQDDLEKTVEKLKQLDLTSKDYVIERSIDKDISVRSLSVGRTLLTMPAFDVWGRGIISPDLALDQFLEQANNVEKQQYEEKLRKLSVYYNGPGGP